MGNHKYIIYFVLILIAISGNRFSAFMSTEQVNPFPFYTVVNNDGSIGVSKSYLVHAISGYLFSLTFIHLAYRSVKNADVAKILGVVFWLHAASLIDFYLIFENAFYKGIQYTDIKNTIIGGVIIHQVYKWVKEWIR